MGKRLKWFNEKEVSEIIQNKLDYTTLYNPSKSKDKSDQKLAQEEVIDKYRKIEKQRLDRLKGEKITFNCPQSIDKSIKKFRQLAK